MKIHNINAQTLHNYLRPGYNIIFKAGSDWFNKVNIGDQLNIYNGSVLLARCCTVDAVVTIPFWKVRETEIQLNHQDLSRNDLRNALIKDCRPNDGAKFSQLIITMILTKV